MIFFIVIVVILSFVVLWNFDLHRILHVKSISQNAGDSAAVMASRWQAITLNLVGDLNIMHAAALAAGDADSCNTITSIQARLCYVGPMIAFMASQEAAKNNGVYVNEDFTQYLHEHARKVRDDYPYRTSPTGQPLFPEPYPGAWREYAAMIEQVATEGVAAGPDNAEFYNDVAGGDHFLLLLDFYEAIAGREWCWFYFHAYDLLKTYKSYRDWPPLPDPPNREYMNCEFFGLGLTKRTTTLASMAGEGTVVGIAADRELAGDAAGGMYTSATWYCYSPGYWAPWEAFSVTGPDPFPAAGPVKDQYNYTGADAVLRVESPVTRLTPAPHGSAATNLIVWTAAAKPFGYLAETERPDSCGVVLPAFHQAGLIPLDTSSAPSGGSYNLAWRRHIEIHLPEYLDHGPPVCESCWYCQQLVLWEKAEFRQIGIDWLAVNSSQCLIRGPGPGGGGGSGGRRRGH